RPLVVGKGLESSRRRAARVRNDDIHAAERFDRTVDERPDPVRIGDVRRNRRDLRVGFLPDGLRGILESTGVSRADGDLASFSGERERNSPTESLARRGDKGYFAPEAQSPGAPSGPTA